MMRAVDDAALAARLAHHLGVVARAGDREGRGIDGAEHVEIDEAVVERRDQRVGHRMREPHQVGVGARRIDHDEVVDVLDRVDRLGEAGELGRLVLVEPRACRRARCRNATGSFEVEPGARRPGAAVLDVMGEALLAGVEIDGGDPLAAFISATATCIAVVDLPEPPFSLPSTTTCADDGRPACANMTATSVAASPRLSVQLGQAVRIHALRHA